MYKGGKMRKAVNDKNPEEREVAVHLKTFKSLMNISDEYIGEQLHEKVEVIKKIEKNEDKKIPLEILYKLYWFANKEWLINVEVSSERKVEKIICTRKLRDACDDEILRRS